jgi:hypothetical protein
VWVDVVAVLTDNDFQGGRNYWKVLKHRLKDEGNQTVTNCNQLKLLAPDGKLRLTDVAESIREVRAKQKSSWESQTVSQGFPKPVLCALGKSVTQSFCKNA